MSILYWVRWHERTNGWPFFDIEDYVTCQYLIGLVDASGSMVGRLFAIWNDELCYVSIFYSLADKNEPMVGRFFVVRWPAFEPGYSRFINSEHFRFITIISYFNCDGCSQQMLVAHHTIRTQHTQNIQNHILTFITANSYNS